jgi:hypothetical protein
VDKVLRLRALRRPVGRERTHRTFTFATGSPAANPYLEQKIREVVTRELVARGLAPTAGNPDLVAVTHVITYEQKGLDTWYSRATPLPGDATAPSLRRAMRRTILIDLFEPGNGKLVWCGSATDLTSDTRGGHGSRIERTLRRAFANYPLSN